VHCPADKVNNLSLTAMHEKSTSATAGKQQTQLRRFALGTRQNAERGGSEW